MPTVKKFNDSSAVSVAYAFADGDSAADVQGEVFNYFPYTDEGFQMSKEPKMSTAITNDRRPANSKNTKGTASGSIGLEFGATAFIQDMLAATLMTDWKPVDGVDIAQGTYAVDGELPRFLCVEKTSRAGTEATDMLYHERYYGTAVNDATIEFGDGELITMALNFMAVNANYTEAVAGAGGLGGSLASEKTVPGDYEIADSSNNLKNIIIRDEGGVPMEVVFTDLSIQIQNNAREQSALGKEFAAGMGFGKVAVTLTGEVYFYDQTLLGAHMQNRRLSGEFQVDTSEGVFTFELPNLMVQTPTNNSEGENQDYKTSLTLSAERGTVTIGAEEVTCVVAVKYVAK